ncbi:MAG: LysR family transcriptional regulator [Eggerthellaceae bacterium]|nr:LysR family transcriptional regulator [Eggerthellaceae bacterium]
MNTNALRYFKLAYQSKNFTAAAQKAPISVQGLTKAVGSIEKELDVKLFTPDEKGAKAPTPYADALMAFVDNLDMNLARLKGEINAIRARERHEIRLASSVGILGWLGHDFIKGFSDAHPGVQMTITEAPDHLVDEMLSTGMADMAFTMKPFRAEFATVEFDTVRVCYWVNASHSLSKMDEIGIDDLNGVSLAFPGHGFKCYDALMGACTEKGIQLGEFFSMSEIFWIYNYVLAGQGIGFAAESHTALPSFTRADKVLSIPSKDIRLTSGLSYLRTHFLNAHELEFFKYCERFGKDVDG